MTSEQDAEGARPEDLPPPSLFVTYVGVVVPRAVTTNAAVVNAININVGINYFLPVIAKIAYDNSHYGKLSPGRDPTGSPRSIITNIVISCYKS